jgi:hypothetical protein
MIGSLLAVPIPWKVWIKEIPSELQCENVEAEAPFCWSKMLLGLSYSGISIRNSSNVPRETTPVAVHSWGSVIAIEHKGIEFETVACRLWPSSVTVCELLPL